MHPPVPTTLSDLLVMALDDARQIEQQPGYVFDMHVWHDGTGDTCRVCMAGAIMVRRLGAEPTTHMFPGDMGPEWQRALYAVNDMRMGDMHVAYYELTDTRALDVPGAWDVLRRTGLMIKADYDRAIDRASWKTYEAVVEMLRQAGL